MCIARNKRRRSAGRYKGLAKVVHRRARKGFNFRFNPDSHWSSALYSGLNKIQYTDGTNITNIGRDDQAGFRLVKAAGLHEKGPPQHMANLRFLEQQDAVKPAFINPINAELKDVECIRVDGSFMRVQLTKKYSTGGL